MTDDDDIRNNNDNSIISFSSLLSKTTLDIYEIWVIIQLFFCVLSFSPFHVIYQISRISQTWTMRNYVSFLSTSQIFHCLTWDNAKFVIRHSNRSFNFRKYFFIYDVAEQIAKNSIKFQLEMRIYFLSSSSSNGCRIWCLFQFSKERENFIIKKDFKYLNIEFSSSHE